MKKILVSLAIVFSASSVFASSQSDAYQQGVEMAKQAQQNQEQWAQGKGDPKMAQAYQQGVEMAKQAQQNQEQWAQVS